MDTVLDRAWTAENFLAWEDRQEGKHEFDGARVVPMTGGSVAHQKIVLNLSVLLGRLLAGTSLEALHEMRLRVGRWVRYPDVIVCAGPLDQTLGTLTDAIVIFEILSKETAETDRVAKPMDYADVPSLQYYIILNQSSRAADVRRRAPGGAWTTIAQAEGAVGLPELDLVLPFADIYRGLSFPDEATDRSAD